ncbi:MAG: CPBP family intramembrane metalloprotease [Microbacteriaceae bacterium]|nr:CPBP family intramembrane metalloprotease [Microbacteriaceae bacterium]
MFTALRILSVVPETPGLGSVALGYGVVWIPLLTAVAFVTSTRGADSFCDSVGAKFRPIDLLWGISVGLLLRVFANVVAVVVTGHLPSPAVSLNSPEFGIIYFLTSIVAPIIIAPVVEELFFRGLVLRAIFDRNRHRPLFSYKALLALISSTFFAVMHLTQETTTTRILVTGITLFGFSIATSILSMSTRRLGGSIVAHAVFNGLAIN